jgi:hypothetical protein
MGTPFYKKKRSEDERIDQWYLGCLCANVQMGGLQGFRPLVRGLSDPPIPMPGSVVALSISSLTYHNQFDGPTLKECDSQLIVLTRSP